MPKLGWFGMFLVAAADTSFISLPELSDLLVVTGAAHQPGRAWTFVLASALGSVLGCLAIYEIGRRGGERVAIRYVSPQRLQWAMEAAAIADGRATSQRDSRLLQGGRISLSGFSQQAKEGVLKELNLILKADVQGSLEAIVGALTQLPQKEVQLRLLLSAPGEITETDIDLAAASNAVIIGFNTTLASGARQAASVGRVR